MTHTGAHMANKDDKAASGAAKPKKGKRVPRKPVGTTFKRRGIEVKK